MQQPTLVDEEIGGGGAGLRSQAWRAAQRAPRRSRSRLKRYDDRNACGGYKKSGLGRETHKSMLEAYSQKKNIYVSLNEAPLGLF